MSRLISTVVEEPSSELIWMVRTVACPGEDSRPLMMLKDQLPKLTKTVDGYRGNFLGRPFTVTKEENPDYRYGLAPGEGWIARADGVDCFQCRTPSDTVRMLCQAIADDVATPELDALLARWASEIKALVPASAGDPAAVRMLGNLRKTLTSFNAMVIRKAAKIEHDLARLKELAGLQGQNPDLLP